MYSLTFVFVFPAIYFDFFLLTTATYIEESLFPSVNHVQRPTGMCRLTKYYVKYNAQLKSCSGC